jgi:hypothetical protein
MSAPNWRVFAFLFACAVGRGAAQRTEAAASPAGQLGLCATLVAESEEPLRQAKAALFPRDATDSFDRAFDIALATAFRTDRLCAEGASGAWSIVFGRPHVFVDPERPRRTYSVVPWKLVHVDRRGRRSEVAGTNPFARVRGYEFVVRDGAATITFGELFVPRLVTGDFDGTGREQAIVFTEYPNIDDPEQSPDPEYDERSFHWPKDPALGVAYILRNDRIERRKSLLDVWISSARRAEDSGEWELKSYGPFFEFKPACRFDVSERGYPVFGPEFNAFRGGSDGLTLDDPRQVPLLRAQCAKAVNECEAMLSVENVAIFDAVCERVPGAPVTRKNKSCAHSIAGVERVRPGWRERLRRIAVPGVRGGADKLR